MRSDTITVRLAQRGIFTLPKGLREAYRLNPGDDLTLLDLGGFFVIIPRRLEVDKLGDRIAAALADRGEDLESILKELRREREETGRKRGVA